jgi:hypothetical protein
LSAGFTGHPEPLDVAWQRGTVIHARESGGGSESFFALTNVQPSHAGTWRVTVRNAASTHGVSASFKLTVLPDANGDGLPDGLGTSPPLWTNVVGGAKADSDGDGLSDLEEYRAGTNPTNAESRLELFITSVNNGARVLRFQVMSNRTYSVERSSNVDGPWLRLLDVVAAKTNRILSFTDDEPVSEKPVFLYRVGTPRMPTRH